MFSMSVVSLPAALAGALHTSRCYRIRAWAGARARADSFLEGQTQTHPQALNPTPNPSPNQARSTSRRSRRWPSAPRRHLGRHTPTPAWKPPRWRETARAHASSAREITSPGSARRRDQHLSPGARRPGARRRALASVLAARRAIPSRRPSASMVHRPPRQCQRPGGLLRLLRARLRLWASSARRGNPREAGAH